MPKFNYMEKQSDISFPMRSILVDWVVEVGEEFDVETETVHLAVNYIDRFLSYMSVQRAKLQLVGTSSMFIASKYEEIYPKELDKFVYITDDTYNKRQVLKVWPLTMPLSAYLKRSSGRILVFLFLPATPSYRSETLEGLLSWHPSRVLYLNMCVAYSEQHRNKYKHT